MSLNERSTSSISFPPTFETREIETNGVTIHARVGGTGPAVVMLHGFGTTGDMWIPVASVLAGDHTVIVPDLRGLGLSSKPSGGYDKKTQNQDVAGVMDALVLSTLADVLLISVLANRGWAMAPLPVTVLAMVMGAAVAFWMVLNIVKIPIFKGLKLS